MRVAKIIDYKKARQLERFGLLKKKIRRSIEKNPEGPIAKLENVSKLNYFLVIDCKDVSEELGVEDTKSVSPFLFGSKEKNKKFIQHIKKKNMQPSYFKKIGLFYDISGCYLVTTTKDSEKGVNIYNTINTVSCKLEINNLPPDIKAMCIDYESYNVDNQIKTNPYLSDIFNISSEDRDSIIENIVSSLTPIDIPLQNKYPTYSIDDMYEFDNFSGFNIEDIIESKIEDIYDVSFLEHVMKNSIKSENYELCSKIRDRIEKIKKID